MKLVKVILPVLIIALIFSGCSFRLASSVDELISPVSPQGDDADVQNALYSYTNGAVTLKNASDGEYTSAYTFYDLDSDNEEEAVVFYETSKSIGSINMAVIDKINGKWSVIYNIASEYEDIYSLGFSDLNGDGVTEIIALWDAISDSKSHFLSVYCQSSKDGGYQLSEIGSRIAMNDYISVDIDENGVDELLVFSVDSGDSVSASAVLYSYADSSRKTLGTTKLDGHISFYKSITTESKNGRVYIYADAVKSNGSQMLTEIIHWSDYYGTIISPYYSYSTGITKNTTRSVMLTCRDIDGDGNIELPLDPKESNTPNEVRAVRWAQYDNSVLNTVCYSFAVEKDSYQIVFNENGFDKLYAEYNSEKSELTVFDSNSNAVFSVLPVLKSHYDEAASDYSGYTEIMSNSGYVYLAQAFENSDISVSVDDLKLMIKSYEGE